MRVSCGDPQADHDHHNLFLQVSRDWHHFPGGRKAPNRLCPRRHAPQPDEGAQHDEGAQSPRSDLVAVALESGAAIISCGTARGGVLDQNERSLDRSGGRRRGGGRQQGGRRGNISCWRRSRSSSANRTYANVWQHRAPAVRLGMPHGACEVKMLRWTTAL